MAALAKTALIILDDWGLAQFADASRHNVLERLEDRHGRRATMVTSQFPVEHWHEALDDPPLADAILDRLVHNAYKLSLKGDSMRTRLLTPKPEDAKASDHPSGWSDGSRSSHLLGPDKEEDNMATSGGAT